VVGISKLLLVLVGALVTPSMVAVWPGWFCSSSSILVRPPFRGETAVAVVVAVVSIPGPACSGTAQPVCDDPCSSRSSSIESVANANLSLRFRKVSGEVVDGGDGADDPNDGEAALVVLLGSDEEDKSSCSLPWSRS
jgi:hypothetical protein